jgi:hypothetical protein
VHEELDDAVKRAVGVLREAVRSFFEQSACSSRANSKRTKEEKKAGPRNFAHNLLNLRTNRFVLGEAHHFMSVRVATELGEHEGEFEALVGVGRVGKGKTDHIVSFVALEVCSVGGEVSSPCTEREERGKTHS